MTAFASYILAGAIEPMGITAALYSPGGPLRAPLAEHVYLGRSQSDLVSTLEQFLADAQVSPHMVERACVTVASVDADVPNPALLDLTHGTGMMNLRSLVLLSPLDALAALLPHLRPDEVQVMAEGQPRDDGPLALLVSGPAFQQAALVWDGTRYAVYGSEGGAALVAPTNYLEQKLLVILQDRFGQLSYERICGPDGIPILYAALKQIGVAHEPAWLTPRFAVRNVDPVAVILQAAQQANPTCTLCHETLEHFLALLGTAAAAFALSIRATRGVYIGGTLLPELTWMLDQGWFRDGFHLHGVGTSLLHTLPVTAVVAPNAAVLGAAAVGLCRA